MKSSKIYSFISLLFLIDRLFYLVKTLKILFISLLFLLDRLIYLVKTIPEIPFIILKILYPKEYALNLA
jgi:hypothetical protein